MLPEELMAARTTFLVAVFLLLCGAASPANAADCQRYRYEFKLAADSLVEADTYLEEHNDEMEKASYEAAQHDVDLAAHYGDDESCVSSAQYLNLLAIRFHLAYRSLDAEASEPFRQQLVDAKRLLAYMNAELPADHSEESRENPEAVTEMLYWRRLLKAEIPSLAHAVREVDAVTAAAAKQASEDADRERQQEQAQRASEAREAERIRCAQYTDSAANIVKRVEPALPRGYSSGPKVAEVKLSIRSDGSIDAAEILRSSGETTFDEAALDAANKSTYQAAMSCGSPAEGTFLYIAVYPPQ
jgi:TonB family protein